MFILLNLDILIYDITGMIYLKLVYVLIDNFDFAV